MNRCIVCWLALLVVASFATACAQSKVGTVSTALPFGPSVTANGMAGIGLPAHAELDFTINPAQLGFFGRTASVGGYPVWVDPYLISSEPGFFAASAVVAPLRLLNRSNSRFQFSAGFNWQELKNSIYEVTYAGTFRHQFITRTTQVALGASYHWIVDVGCGVAWRRLFDKDEFAGRSFSATSYDFGVGARVPFTARMPDDRSWSEGPLFVNLVGSAVWTGYGPDITTGTGKYPQAHGRRYSLAAELAYRWMSLCPAIEREASPGYYSTITHYGGELGLAEIVSLRAGKIDYREQDAMGIDQITFGLGLSTHGLKRLLWPPAGAASTRTGWKQLDLAFSFAIMFDADHPLNSTKFYEVRLTY